MTDLMRFVEGYPTMESGLTFLRVVRHACCLSSWHPNAASHDCKLGAQRMGTQACTHRWL